MTSANDDLVHLMARVYLLMHRRLDQAMTEQGASLARTRLLLFVANGGGQARAADIAEMFGQAPRTVTQGLDALERDGLITRVPDAADRRVKRLRITDSGRKAIDASEPLRRALIQDVFGVLDDSERIAMKAIFIKLAAQLPTDANLFRFDKNS